MRLNLSIDIPDETAVSDVAAYLREQADNAAGQIEQGIIDVPEVDDSIAIDFSEDREATLFRSE